ncbi:ABC transporter permease [Acidobacteria bacterium AH-259-A15]|nr:ABC transporter permease [Acidobacteria bacterium AH-259-A15]
MVKLIFSNLRQRPTRTCVSIVAVALGVTLLLVTLGLSYGQLTDNAERTKGVGGDFILQPSEASLIFALNSGTLPVRVRQVIERVEGVGAATPVLAKFLGDKFHLIFGIDKVSFRQVNRNLKFVQGWMFEHPREVIIDTVYANSRKMKVGDQLELLGNQFMVSGIFRQGTGARVLLPLTTLQELNGTPGKATMFFVRAREGTSLEQVYDSLKERFKNYKITKASELQEIIMDTTPAFKPFISSMIFISVAISFLIILLAMYSTITERTREIGILKSLGASKSYIVKLILQESLLICALGVGLGFCLTSVAIQLILATFPSIPVTIPLFWRVTAPVMAITGGTLGALYPAVKAAQMDPVRALGYE